MYQLGMLPSPDALDTNVGFCTRFGQNIGTAEADGEAEGDPDDDAEEDGGITAEDTDDSAEANDEGGDAEGLHRLAITGTAVNARTVLIVGRLSRILAVR